MTSPCLLSEFTAHFLRVVPCIQATARETGISLSDPEIVCILLLQKTGRGTIPGSVFRNLQAVAPQGVCMERLIQVSEVITRCTPGNPG